MSLPSQSLHPVYYQPFVKSVSVLSVATVEDDLLIHPYNLLCDNQTAPETGHESGGSGTHAFQGGCGSAQCRDSGAS